MHNLIKYSRNYSKTSDSMWNYYRDQPNSGAEGNMNYSIKDSKSFNYKKSITGKLEDNSGTKEVEKIVPLKYLSNFWRTLDMPLINCEVSLILTWSENCVITSKGTREANPNVNLAVARINSPTNSTFKITDTKLYVPVVTLSTEIDNKFLEQLKAEFKRTITWNKYRSEVSNQTKNKNLNYLIDPTFSKVNRLFVISFENEGDRNSFSKYYKPAVEIKDFNVLINQKAFFDIFIRNKEEAYEIIIEMCRNNDYTTGNLLDYEYFSKHYKLIAIDLSKQTEFENPDVKHQINFIGRLVRNEGATIFFIIKKKEKNTFDFSQNSVTVV